MSAREDCVAADADFPEPICSFDLTADEARRLLHVLSTTMAPARFRRTDACLASRLMLAIEATNPRAPVCNVCDGFGRVVGASYEKGLNETHTQCEACRGTGRP